MAHLTSGDLEMRGNRYILKATKDSEFRNEFNAHNLKAQDRVGEIHKDLLFGLMSEIEQIIDRGDTPVINITVDVL